MAWPAVRAAWVADNPVKPSVLAAGSPAAAILAKEATAEVDFTPHKDARSLSKAQGLKRYPENPEANWGPKARAAKRKAGETMEEKRRRNQGPRCEGGCREQCWPPRALGPTAHPRLPCVFPPPRWRGRRVDPKARASIPCKRFRAGTCEFGDQCCYSHDPDLPFPTGDGKREAESRKMRRAAAAVAKAEGSPAAE